MSVQLAPLPIMHFADNNGNPLSGGQLFTYAAGTTTPQATYTDSTGGTSNPNPVILNARGEASVWMTPTQAYKLVLKDANGNLIWSQDQVSAPADRASLAATGTPSGASLIGFDGVTLDQQFLSRLNRTVDSVADLAALNPGTYTRAYTTGYYTASDEGGGRAFAYSASTPVGSANGGTIIASTFGSAPAGCWLMESNAPVSVKHFGAKCDGTTNDTTAYNAFVAAMGVTLSVSPLSSTGTLSFNIWSNQGVTADLIATSLGGGPLGGDYLNPIINGAFDRWSNGTSFAIGTHLQTLADGWNFDFNGTVGTGVISRSMVPIASYGANFQPRYCLNFNQSVAGSGNTYYDVSTQIEGVRTLAGQKVTISFWAISNSGTPPAITAVKTEQYCGSGGSPSPSQFNTSDPIQLTSSWAPYSVTFPLASISTLTLGTNADDTLNVIFTMPLNQTFDISIADAQINPGPVPMPFNFNDPATVAAKCARRIQTSYDDGTAPGTATTNGVISFIAGSVAPVITIPCFPKFRTPPAVTFYNPATGATGTWDNQGTAVAASVNTNGMQNVSVALSGCTVGTVVNGHYVFEDRSI